MYMYIYIYIYIYIICIYIYYIMYTHINSAVDELACMPVEVHYKRPSIVDLF